MTEKLRYVPMKDKNGCVDHYQVFNGARSLGTLHKVQRKSAPSSDPHWMGRVAGSVPTTAVLPTRKKAGEALAELVANPPPVKLRDLWRDTSTVPPVPKVSKVEMAFPATALDYLPPVEVIPKDFDEFDNPWTRLVETWFGNTRSLAERKLQLALKEDIDMDDLRNLIHVCLGSFAPKHEHKIAGVAYMLSRWCEDFALDGKFQVSGELVPQ